MKPCKSIQQHSAAHSYTATTGGFLGGFLFYFFKRRVQVIKVSDVISEAIHRDCHHYCQTQALVPASQRVVHPRIPLPTFARWIPLAMPSVCLSPVCHAHRLDQVIVAGMSQASAVSYLHESSSPCLLPPLWSEPSVGFCQIYIHPDIQHTGLFNELHRKHGCVWSTSSPKIF